MQSTAGQTWLAQKATEYLSEELNTVVRIDKLKVRFGTSVELHGIYVEDLHQDTLLYSKSLELGIRVLNTSTRKLTIGKLLLADAVFRLVHYKGEAHDNLYFIKNYFSGDTTQLDTASNPWNLELDNLSLANVHFIYDLQDDTAYADIVDFSHLDLKELNGSFKKIHFVNDSMFANIEKLHFIEKSGFHLNNLSAEAKVSSTEMRFNKLNITTPKTDIHTDLTFKYDDFSCFGDFLNCIVFNSDFRNSKVSFQDIALFASEVKQMKPDVTISGKFKGTVNHFKGKNVNIRFGEKSFFSGNIAMNGLPNIDETFMEIEAKEIRTNKKDIESIRFPGNEPDNRIVLTPQIEKLGTVLFKGKFTGFFSDFVAYGNLKTDLGYLSSDINLKYRKDENLTYYSGHLSTNNFDIGRFWSLSDFGAVTLSANVKGKGFTLDRMSAKLTGAVGSLWYRSYNYQDIVVDADVSKKLFNGSLAIHEPNVDLDFKGSVNFENELPVFNFTSDLKSLQLDKVKLFDFDKDANLQVTADIELTGNKIDNLAGKIVLSNLNYREEKTLYHVSDLELTAENLSPKSRLLRISSDNLEAQFRGTFEFATIRTAFNQIMQRYVPAVVSKEPAVKSNQDFEFDIHVRNASLLTNLFMPGWYIDPNTSLKGKFNSTSRNINFKLRSALIKYNNFAMKNLSMDGETTADKLFLRLDGEKLNYSDSGKVWHPSLNASIENNNVRFKVGIADSLIYANRVYLQGDLLLADEKRFDIKLDSAYIILDNSAWRLSDSNRIFVDTTSVTFSKFKLYKPTESIDLEGTLSERSEDTLKVYLKDFQLANLNILLDNSGTELSGNSNGSFLIHRGANKTTMFQSNLSIDNLVLNKDTLGNTSVVTGFDNISKVLSLKANIRRGNAITFDLTGNYNTALHENNLDFDIHLNSIYLNTFSKYTEGIVSDLRGKLSADLKLTGSVKQPVLDGKVHFTKGSALVDYLGTRYSLTDDVKVSENKFIFSDFTLNDVNGKTAVVNGVIRHNYFKEFDFDLQLKAKDFECLNTTALQNSLYYGKAYASGHASFKGPIEKMDIDITLSSRKGTVISIPLGGGSEMSQSGFITFVKHDEDEENEARPRMDFQGVNLEMAFEVTPDAELQLIFDEKIGDVISGRGSGNIRMVVGDDGTFKMYGTYLIDRGTYLFTLRNVINKKFQIAKGGSISWIGDPYDANIDLRATYRLYTSTLYYLIQDSTYRQRLPVDCHIELTNKLMNPTINYSIEVPGVDATVQSQITSVLNSEAEVSKQFFGLLMLNQFIPQGNSNQFSNAYDGSISANAAELLSNQVSNWLNQVSDEVTIGFRYQAKDAYSNEQYEFMFGKSFLDDRLSVETNVGYVSPSSQQASNIIGEFTAEYKISSDGRFRIKAFNESNENDLANYNAPYTQGVGVFYREEFNNLKELLIRWGIIRKKETKTEEGTKTSKN